MVRDCSGYQFVPSISAEWLELFEEMKQSSEASMEIKKIYFDVGATVVFWEDGTKTVVRRHQTDPDDKKAAVCAAVAKKLFGSNSAIEREIREKGQFSKRMQEAMGDTAEAAFGGMTDAVNDFFDSVDEMIPEKALAKFIKEELERFADYRIRCEQMAEQLNKSRFRVLHGLSAKSIGRLMAKKEFQNELDDMGIYMRILADGKRTKEFCKL